MAIVGPADLPSVLKVKSDPCKKYIFSKLGYPQVNVEIHEDQLETLLRTAGDFIAGYFPREQRLAVFYTTPLKNTYPMPADAYWIQSCNWDPLTTRIDDVFGAESFLFNIGNISGIQNILVDYHLLASYRKFSQRVLGSEGHWEVIGETDGTGDVTVTANTNHEDITDLVSATYAATKDLTAGIAYSTMERTRNSVASPTDAKLMTLSLAYTMGPVVLSYDFERATDSPVDAISNSVAGNDTTANKLKAKVNF